MNEIKWRELPLGVSASIEELFGITGYVMNVETGILPSGHRQMAGLQTARWSGYAGDARVAGGITGLGE